MDLMLSSETAWQSQYQGLMEMDEAHLPECAESFITLMLTITGEYICTYIIIVFLTMKVKETKCCF